MRPAYNAEIKFLVFLFFVGIVEVIQNFSEKLRFLGSESIGYVEIESTEFLLLQGVFVHEQPFL